MPACMTCPAWRWERYMHTRPGLRSDLTTPSIQNIDSVVCGDQQLTLSLTRNSATLKPMKMFRLVLTLLLCLTVPAAGWASALSGPTCPQLRHAHGLPHAAAHHSETTPPVASVVSKSPHQHEHCGSLSTRSKPCKGDQCACGCGMGSCASSQLLPLTLEPSALLRFAGKDLLPRNREPAFAATRVTSPLRPPIA